MDTGNGVWLDRLSAFEAASTKLSGEELPAPESDGLFFRFRYCFGLACEVMKHYFIRQGNVFVTDPGDAIRETVHNRLITDGETERKNGLATSSASSPGTAGKRALQ
jgi:hypothetical protein